MIVAVRHIKVSWISSDYKMQRHIHFHWLFKVTFQGVVKIKLLSGMFVCVAGGTAGVCGVCVRWYSPSLKSCNYLEWYLRHTLLYISTKISWGNTILRFCQVLSSLFLILSYFTSKDEILKDWKKMICDI